MSDINDFGIGHEDGDDNTMAAKMHDFGTSDAPHVSKHAMHDDADDEEKRNLDTILGIPVDVQVVLGSASMLVANLLKLGRGSVIPLNHRVGEPVDIVVNGRVVARGEVVVVEDDNSRFGVSLTEIIGNQAGALEA
ncbi:flagellar motor switch protein FliN [Breoghania corrubedonensis]|uniref:Flagellar motor switch protein FliN n=2 Tax=Breoghania corrubedonensis TaxID=665038 RepID=A0A2T5V8U2_9HYPH|nr:flagellar motor switch protein FliN [Breoghania corrubedonensis]